jgi:hypothetical protein
MDNQLSRGEKSRSESEAVDHIIQSALKKTHECLARDPWFFESLFNIVSELLFRNPIGEPQFLLLCQALFIITHLPPKIRVHSGRSFPPQKSAAIRSANGKV